MGARVARARAYAAELSSLTGRVVTVDPAEAAANLPAVLILPPRLLGGRLGGGPDEIEWRLAVITEPPPGLAAWEQLDELLEELEPHITMTAAEPGVYTLAGDRDPLPAYLVTAPE